MDSSPWTVALHHAAETSVPASLLARPVVGPVVGSLFFGQFAVIVFFLLAGFCLYLPLVRETQDAPELRSSFGRYLARRWARLAPPYYVAGVFCIALTAFPSARSGRSFTT